jgi:predicted ArsR family transcriptional regulator
MDLATQAAGIGALADATRRLLYEYVVAQPEPVGREQAAAALGVAQHNVNFHLDRLADDGLLEVEYRRLSGRTGPGSGRPSKLYRRGTREFAVSLPPRRYELAADLLAEAVTRAADGVPLAEALERVAREEGRALGAAAEVAGAGELERVAVVLGGQGYEPQRQDAVMTLNNCPFDALARRHTALVCGLNRDFVQGVVEGLGCGSVVACLEPGVGRCCVTVRTADPGPG